MQQTVGRSPDLAPLGDAELVALAREGSSPAFRAIMERHNRRLYRLSRAILRNDADAEDVVQEAYVRAFTHLDSFRGESSLATWLTRIVLNEALGRLRRRRVSVDLDVLDAEGRSEACIIPFPLAGDDPEKRAAQRQISVLLERAIDDLPEPFRLVFVLRDVEEMSIGDTAAHLGIKAETVKTRLHRARRLLRQALHAQLASVLSDAFPFAGARCARIVETVLRRLENPAERP